ncbi:hypothetical protein [Clostridium sp. AM49-4BH]|uniref:hypothetical protein n=1 Tax=Clostridium sp. AM49-4BH TaxID=2293035 RepID=UPI000E522D46|nr:hypothetical protein [Clostridium sp. AM49-4BH]RHQ09623.1 hypothetical protein DW981_12965 [Clostridium sp. AM49-4BH]
MRINKTKLLSYGIVLSMTAVSMLSTSPLASAAGNVRMRSIRTSRAWTKIHFIRDGEKKGIHQRCIAILKNMPPRTRL